MFKFHTETDWATATPTSCGEPAAHPVILQVGMQPHREGYAPDALERVRAMVVAESRCGAFLSFDLREEPDSVCVTITAPENARDAADELFAQFVAAAAASQSR